jgi:TPR repeat protein
VGDKKITILGMSHYPLPNGYTFVFLRFKWAGITYYEEHQVPGSLVWSSNKSETIYQRHQLEEARRCALVVNSCGFVNTWFKIPDNFAIWNIADDIFCFLVDKTVNTSNMTIYNSFKCLDSNGSLVWEPKNDFMAFDFFKTNNNLYVAGEKLGDEVRSLVRGYDIRTGKVVIEKIGKNRGICFGLKYGEDGIDYTEYLESDNSRKQLYIPVEANDEAAFRRKILSSYNQNNASDQVAIGERYLKGRGLEKNEKKAFEWFQKAANQYNPVGLFQLAKCYQDGIGVSQDKAQAAVYYEKSASLHNTDAILSLSDMYIEGDGIEKNMSKALSLKEELAFGGNTNAQKFVLSNQSVEYTKFNIPSEKVLSLARENYMNKTYEWAKFCYERAIYLGNADAMFEYGKWLYEGIGISKDCDKALELLRKVGEDNNIKAQVLLTHIYAENKGVTPDLKQEMYWCMKAADNGDTESQLKLANAYQDGIGVKKDKKLAFEMLRRAAANGNEDAIKQVVLSYALGNGVKKDMYSAAVWSEKMKIDDQLAIARMFYYGDGVKKILICQS